MATENELLIKIKADSDKAIADIKNLSKEVDRLTKENKKYAATSKDIEKISKSYQGISNTVKGVVAGLASLGVAMKAVEFAKLASDAEQAKTAFTSIMQSMGLDAETEFNRIKEASEGLISDKALYEATTKAVSLGVPFEKIGDLMEVAKVKAKDMGISLTQAFSDMATGIGRGSPMILDNLGLTIKLEEGNKKYAESLGITVSEMTAQQKTMALTNQVLEAGAEAVTRYSDAGETSAEKFQKLEAQLENTQVLIGQKLLPLVADATDSILKFIDSLDQGDWDNIESGINGVGTALKGLMSILGTAASGWQKIGEWLEYGYDNMRLITDSGFAEEIRDITKNEDELNKILKKQGELLDENQTVTKKQIDLQEEAINAAIDNNLKQLAQLDDAIAKGEELNKTNGFTIVSTEEYKTALVALEEQNKKLYLARAELNKEEAKVDDQIAKAKELTAERQREAEATKKQEEAQKKLNDEQSKLFEKNKEALSKRLATNQDTLIKLQEQERKHKDELAKLEEELQGIRQGYANKRSLLEMDINSQIANIYAKGLNDYEAYRDAQRRADEAYANAKKAIESGNIELARAYLSEYNSLVTQSAGEEIVLNEKVQLTKAQTAAEAKKDLLAGKALTEQIYNLEEQKEIELHTQKMNDKRAEIELVKIQIEAQKALVEQIAKIVEMATGAKFDMDFSAVNAAVAKLDADLAATSQKDREAKINVTANAAPAEADIEEAKDEAEEPSIMLIKADMTPAQKAIRDLQTSGDSEIQATYDLDTAPAEMEYKEFYKQVTGETLSVHHVQPDAAAAFQAKAELQQNTSSQHTIFVRTVQTNATGGEVGIGKFATGGGYAKRRGKIPGHDLSGKDDVPSLLTRGEFVQNVRAVDYYGTAFMKALNARAIPKEALRLAEGGEVETGASKSVNLSLIMPDNKTSFQMQTDDQVASALERYLRKYQ